MAQALMTNDSGKSPFTLDQLRKIAPSVFQTGVHESRSITHYKPIPTIAVLEALRTQGWQVYSVQQTVVRDDSRHPFTKHMLRMRQGGAKELVDAAIQRGNHVFIDNGPEYNELVMTNSSDGSSSFELNAGIFRLICLNGAISGKSFGSIRIPHRGDVEGLVIDGATRIVEQFDLMSKYRHQMAEIPLDPYARLAFAQQALKLRYGEVAPPITAEGLLYVRREADNKPNLWTTFNVVQENLIKGGIRGVAASGRRMVTRGITGISQDVAINRELWDLADFVRRVARGEQVVPDYELEEDAVEA